MKKTTRLRQLVESPELLIAPGAYDPLLARCIEQAGFDAVYMTGGGISQSALGMPDLGLSTLTEMVDKAYKIADVTDIPLIADADTGYGNALNVIRTIKAYERAGVSACHIEDQDLPKRCGHFDGKELVPLDEMLGKLKAALDTRVDPDFLIIARTDANTAVGFNEAIERAQAFAEVGVDIVFVESPRNLEEMQKICASINKPLLANMVEGGLTPILPKAELQKLGYSLAIYPGALGRLITRQVTEFLKIFKEEGTTLSQRDKMYDFTQQNAIVGLPEFLETVKKYAS